MKKFAVRVEIFETKTESVPVRIIVYHKGEVIIKENTFSDEEDKNDSESVWQINYYQTHEDLSLDEVRGIFKLFGLLLHENDLFDSTLKERLYNEFNEESKKEGWSIFHTGQQRPEHNIYELQRMDEMDIFKSDRDAMLFVVNSAIKNPEGIHLKALKWLQEYSPKEIGSISKVLQAQMALDYMKLLKIEDIASYL